MNLVQATKLIEELFDSWYPTLMRYAYRMSGSAEFAEDMVQETFFSLYRELARGNTVEHPKAWCLCVLRRDLLRQRHRLARQNASPLPNDLENFSAGCVDPEYTQFLFHDVFRFFDRLSEREEQVLLLRMESLKYGEIAAQLGITSNSVSTLLARALRKLRIAVGRIDEHEQTKVIAEEIELANAHR